MQVRTKGSGNLRETTIYGFPEINKSSGRLLRELMLVMDFCMTSENYNSQNQISLHNWSLAAEIDVDLQLAQGQIWLTSMIKATKWT